MSKLAKVSLPFLALTFSSASAAAQEPPGDPSPTAPPTPTANTECGHCGEDGHRWSWHRGYTPVLAARHPLLGSDSGAIRNGGLFFAIGPRMDTVATRLRGGYEIGFGRSVVFAGAVESDARERIAIVPTLELASGRWGFFPSFGVGAGVPVQWRKDETAFAGGRAQVTLSWGFSSVLFTYDNYPAAPAGYHTESALAFQLSL